MPGAAPDDVRHHVGQQIRDLRPDDLRRQIFRRNQRLAVIVRAPASQLQRCARRPLRRACVRGAAAGSRGARPHSRAGDMRRRSACCKTLAARILDPIDVVRSHA